MFRPLAVSNFLAENKKIFCVFFFLNIEQSFFLSFLFSHYLRILKLFNQSHLSIRTGLTTMAPFEKGIFFICIIKFNLRSEG